MGYKSEFLPASVLRCMAKPDRKPLGKAGVTTEEANERFTAKREKEVHRDIANWLRQHNIWFAHSRMDRKTTQAKGVPDFLFCWVESVEGNPFRRPVAIEVKTGNSKLTPEQIETANQMIPCGWSWHCVGSLDELRKAVPL